MPAKTAEKDIVRTSGGKNSTILVGEIDISSLRNFQINNHIFDTNSSNKYKITPPEFNRNIVMDKILNNKEGFLKENEHKNAE